MNIYSTYKNVFVSKKNLIYKVLKALISIRISKINLTKSIISLYSTVFCHIFIFFTLNPDGVFVAKLLLRQRIKTRDKTSVIEYGIIEIEKQKGKSFEC